MKNRVSLRIFQLLLLIVVCVGIGYIAGSYKVSASWKNFKPIVSINNQGAPESTNLDMTLFYQVLDKVNSGYYDKSKIDVEKLQHGAISGMLQSLGDPYTSFFAPKANDDFKTQMAGEFSGIGAELSQNEQGNIIVMAPLDDSPALKAGIRSGDIIGEVDGKSTSGWDIEKAVENIRGPKGSKVVLTILHEGEKTPKELAITRDTIQIKSVTGWLKNFSCQNGSCAVTTNCATCPSVAYIRVSQFGDKTNTEWIATVNDLLPQIRNQKNFKGIVLDVRNNPGGYLGDAVFIASEFLKEGDTVVIQEDGQKKQEPLKAMRQGLFQNYPLLVLINKGSASASEILSGALRDYDKGLLIGETSFGKGTIQEPVELDGGGSVHISVGKWLTPKQTWVHEKGLKPDIEVKYDATGSAKMKDNMDNQILKAVSELSK